MTASREGGRLWEGEGAQQRAGGGGEQQRQEGPGTGILGSSEPFHLVKSDTPALA